MAFLLAGLITGCAASGQSEPQPTPTNSPQYALQLEQVHTSLKISSPTNLAWQSNGGLFIAEQQGRLWFLEPGDPSGEDLAAEEILDIRDRMEGRQGEEGLLGLALLPGDSGRLFVYHTVTNPRRSVVARYDYQVGDTVTDLKNEMLILELEQPYLNHNGGQIAFGPDGYLYIGLGDGGLSGDPMGNGQDTSTLLGSILRIDVSQSTPEQPYAIPPDNPFANGGGRPEIWAYGFRNPWRFSFDRDTGELWAGDVGQDRWEEIDLIERGGNYGWNILEGAHCFKPSEGCNREGAIPPVWEYSLEGESCSVIGGFVYRGSNIPWLTGFYVYGDFCSGNVFGLRYTDGEVKEHMQLADTDLMIISFAQDNHGELYLQTRRSGIFRLTD